MISDRRHRVNPGRTPHQRRRGKQSYDYLHGWSQGWQDARAGKTRPIPRQSGGGKPPKPPKPPVGLAAFAFFFGVFVVLITYFALRGR